MYVQCVRMCLLKLMAVCMYVQMYVCTVCTYVSPEVDSSLYVCTDVRMYVQCVRMCLLKLMAVCMYPLLFGTGSVLHRCSVVWALYSPPTLVWWGCTTV